MRAPSRKPNLGTNQYISSIPQPVNVREDVVRIDHAINSKLQLMGHLLHEPVSVSFFPPLWGDSTIQRWARPCKTRPGRRSSNSLRRFHPTCSTKPQCFTAATRSPSPPSPVGGSFVQPSGWTATSFFPVANNQGSRLPEIDLQGTPLNTNWSSSYFPWKNGYEGFEYRDDLSYTRGTASVQGRI
jgi:hypothetical protein